MDKKKTIIKRILLIISAVVILVGGFWIGFFTSRLTMNKELENIDFIISMYRAHYYDEQEDVVGIFSRSLLDRYSAYYTAEEYSAIKTSDSGIREGLLGVTFAQLGTGEEAISIVFDVYGNSPMQNAGAKVGDIIKAVKFEGETEQTPVTELDPMMDKVKAAPSYSDIFFYMERNGEPVEIVVQKENYLQTFVKYFDAGGEYGFSDRSGSMEFVRIGDNEEYPVEDEKTAVLKYYGFSGTSGGLKGSVGQFARVMAKFKEDGRKNIILDLRGNGGGFLDIMQTVLRYFVNSDTSRPVVSVIKDKHGNETNYKASTVVYGEFGFENIIILADTGTASAAEAFIGAVLDYDKDNICKVIVSGGRTYGKGIMQTTYERPLGDAIKLTTAKLFWPVSGICIHDVGITGALDNRVYDESAYGYAFSDALAFCR